MIFCIKQYCTAYYGLIFNKATQKNDVRYFQQRHIEPYLLPLEKKPYVAVVLKKEGEVSKEEKDFSLDSENSSMLYKLYIGKFYLILWGNEII